MIKRILIPLDPEADSTAAIALASRIAARHRAEVSGLTTVDTDSILATASGVGLGNLDYASAIQALLTDRSRTAAQSLGRAFDQALDQAQLRHDVRTAEGSPIDRIVEETKYHDVLIVGRRLRFDYVRPEQDSDPLAHLVKQSVIPTIIVGTEDVEVERVLVAYDGSIPSARTLQRLAQLQPVDPGVELHLVHVQTDPQPAARTASERMLKQADGFLRAHGFNRITLDWMNATTPGPRLVAHARDIQAHLIVAGAHSVSAMHRLVFGSTTHYLLQESAVPLFTYR